MRIEELREAKHRRPFVPFRILPAGGEPIPIVHPDAVVRPASADGATLFASLVAGLVRAS